MRQLFATLLAGAVLIVPVVSRAQSTTDYPNRPIRLVVGFAPGGATDTLARLLTGALGQELGQTIYVENIAGASGYIAWRNVAASVPDGYTLLMAENAVAIRPGFKDMTPTFDPVTELDAVASVAHSPLALCVADAVPVNSVKELIAYSHSGKALNYASAGTGSVAQLVWEVVKEGAKIDALSVPYRGGGPAMAAIIAGQVDVIMASSQVAKPLVEDKRIKALAVTGKERSPALPDVPTLTEAGVTHADVDLQFWFGVFGPKDMPADVKTKLEKAVQKALESPAVGEPRCTRHQTGIRTRCSAADAAAERDQKLDYLHRGQGAQGELVRR
jgi:tripartite-type tricarboxylate transporter receptor subunit TctC